MTYDVAIIGAGLGGLECGYILARHGWSVCVLEQDAQIGGCLQTFRRGGYTLDTGFHFVGGLDEGQPLHELFRYFGLLDLPWHRLDDEAFAEVVIDGRTYRLATGYERFVDTLAADFPQHREELEQYTALLRRVGGNIRATLRPGTQADPDHDKWFGQSAYEYLLSTITHPTLRRVLSGASLTMELAADTLPLYTFAQINNSFIQSTWRLQGGGHQIADRLADGITAQGGTVRTRARVVRLVEADGRVTAVECDGGERVQARHVISDAHPAHTLSLLADCRAVRPIYRRRITALPNTCGMFTTHLLLRPGCVPYRNRNLFVYEGSDPWQPCPPPGAPVDKLLVSFQVPAGGGCTRNIDLLTPMSWDEVAAWSDTRVGHRGDAYRELKASKAAQCANLAARYLPGLLDGIEHISTSTPLTYRDYTGTWQGSAYGIRKDCRDPMRTLLTPATPLPNLLLTGQNLALHGVLGVTMTAFATCAALLGGMDEATRGLW